jgi:ABC-type glycerol-3-phosphate transport system substrate-binding protein
MRIPALRRARTLMTAAVVGAAALGLASCGGDDGGSGSNSSTVTLWSSVDAPVQAGLQKALEEKVANDGITIKWETVKDINTLIMQKIAAGDTPDIAFIPQPGVVKDIVSRGAAYPLDDVLDMSALDGSMTAGTLDAGKTDDQLYGLLVSMNVKGLVFYPKPAWDKAGYEKPETIDELNTLTEQIKKDGTTPWCMGIDSPPATGWPATDWFETLIMKYGGVDGYNSWVSHETPFNSDLVKEAGAEFETLLFTDGNVFGGRDGMVNTPFGTAGNPMFKNPPGCYMFNQGSFITGEGFFPDKIRNDLDNQVGVFGFPPVEAGGDNPVEGGGDMAVMMNDTDNVRKVMNYLSETDIGNEAAPNSSFISPHTDFDMSLYPNETTKAMADVAYQSTAFLFDGSDQMPGAVGAGTFWTEMTNYIQGSQDLDTTLTNIDNSWPSS